MRSTVAALIVSLLAFADDASASYTIDLIWSQTGTPTLTFTPAIPATNDGACAAGALAGGHDFSAEWCLEVRLTAAAPLTSAVMTLGWNAANSGVTLGRTGLRSFGQFGGGLAPAGPVVSKIAGTGDCAPACDTAYGSFGGAGPSVVPAGVYTIGSISFDMSGVGAGIHPVLAFLRTGVGGATDKKGNPVPLQLNDASFQFIPEPGTVALLGAGLAALCALGPRRRDARG